MPEEEHGMPEEEQGMPEEKQDQSRGGKRGMPEKEEHARRRVTHRMSMPK
jgi:hypothetical protein